MTSQGDIANLNAAFAINAGRVFCSREQPVNFPAPPFALLSADE
jgi:hypothetical protein